MDVTLAPVDPVDSEGVRRGVRRCGGAQTEPGAEGGGQKESERAENDGAQD